jgi:hypothetical protein
MKEHPTVWHAADFTKATPETLGWEIMNHPPYDRDLSCSDFHLLGPKKVQLGWQKFQTDDEIKHCPEVAAQTFCATGISSFRGWWKKCVSVEEEYLEKEWEFGDLGTYILHVKKIKSRSTLNHPHNDFLLDKDYILFIVKDISTLHCMNR